jgi:cardiolipin synthase A/B
MIPPYQQGNAITLLETGDAYFPALEAAIDAARKEVHLECYIFQADATGQRIAEALKRASARGVVVRMVIDGFGSADLPAAFREELRHAGIRLLVFRPKISPWTLRRHRLRRLHRKVAVIDGSIAFVGGINVIDDRDAPERKPRFDYAVKLEGPILTPIHEAARSLWVRLVFASVRHRKRNIPMLEPIATPAGTVSAAFLQRSNLRHRGEIEEAYLAAIAGATREVIIANAYFFPGRKFRQALLDAAKRGVRVVLLMQGQIEYLLIYYASRALYGSFLDAGIEIYEYHQSNLHAKVAVVDEAWATVGSSNIDPFSLLLALEANVAVNDPGFGALLRTRLTLAIEAGATRMEKKRWESESLTNRIATWLCYGIARFAIGAIGYAGWN